MSTQFAENTDMESRSSSAMVIVKNNMIWSAGVGLLPIPLVEFVAITAVQIKLIKELSAHYDVPFRKDLAKASIVSLLGSLSGMVLGKVLGTSFLRVVPVVGPLIAVASLSAVSASVSYAIGRVFISHFEMGGTLLDFDPSAVRDYFKSQFEEGMKQNAGQKKIATKGKAAAA